MQKNDDLAKRFQETKKETELLEQQLKNYIEEMKNFKVDSNDISKQSGSNGRVQIVRSFDTKHSGHVDRKVNTKTESQTKINRVENEPEVSPRKTKAYDVIETRRYIKKQREKRAEQLKVNDNKKLEAEVRKNKLQELHKKTRELVVRNVQMNRARSKSRERTDYIRLDNIAARSRSVSRERYKYNKDHIADRAHSADKEKHTKDSKNAVQQSGDGPSTSVKKNPDLLYPPPPEINLRGKNRNETANNKIVILQNTTIKKCDTDICDNKDAIEGPLDSTLPVKNIFDYKRINNNSDVLGTKTEINGDDTVPNKKNIKVENTKETQTTMNFVVESNKYPEWLNEQSAGGMSHPFNFINTVKRKLQSTVNKSPMSNNANTSNNIQHLVEAFNEPSSTSCNKNEPGYFFNSLKKSIYSQPQACVSSVVNERLNLDAGKLQNYELVTKINHNVVHKKPLLSTITSRSIKKSGDQTEVIIESESSDTSKNIPEISSESGTSLKKNAESVRRNLSGEIKIEKIKLVNKATTSSSHIDEEVTEQSIPKKMPHNKRQQHSTTSPILIVPELFELNKNSNSIDSIPSTKSFKSLYIEPMSIVHHQLSATMKPQSKSDTNIAFCDIKNSEIVSLLQESTITLTTKNKKQQTTGDSTSTSSNNNNINSNELIKSHRQQHSKMSGLKNIAALNSPKHSIIHSIPSSISVRSNKEDNLGSIDISSMNDDDIYTVSSMREYNNTLSKSGPNMKNPKVTETETSAKPLIHLSSPSRMDYRNNSKSNKKMKQPDIIVITDNSKSATENQTVESKISTAISADTYSSANFDSVSNSNKDVNGNSPKSNIIKNKNDLDVENAKKSSLSLDNSNDNNCLSISSNPDLSFVNTKRGSGSSRIYQVDDMAELRPLEAPTDCLVVNTKEENTKSMKKEMKNSHNGNNSKSCITKNISVRSNSTNNASDLNKTNEIHLKFEAEIHLLNDYNESLRQFSAVEKEFELNKSISNKKSSPPSPNPIRNQLLLQHNFTQTSTQTNTATTNTTNGTSKKNKMDTSSDKHSRISSINYSRGSSIEDGRNISRANESSISTSCLLTTSDLDLSNLDMSYNNNNNNNNNIIINNSGDSNSIKMMNDSFLSNFEKFSASGSNFLGLSVNMFGQLIKDEDARLQNLKTILKIREQVLLDRTKGQLAWLEIQRKQLRETGKLQEASLIKKKQRAVLVNHQKEAHEMRRLKQLQKAASTERKKILEKHSNLIRQQLFTNNMLNNIKVSTPRERRMSGPLKGIQSNHHHSESIRSETSISTTRDSNNGGDKGMMNGGGGGGGQEVYSIMTSQHHSVISRCYSEMSGSELSTASSLMKINNNNNNNNNASSDNAASTAAISVDNGASAIKRTLLMRQAALEKRKKAAEDLLQWHKRLLEEEQRIAELESKATAIICQQQKPNSNNNNNQTTGEKYTFKGDQLNQLWYKFTGSRQNKFVPDKIYPMSQVALERFCKSAREYSAPPKINKHSEENIPKHSVIEEQSKKDNEEDEEEISEEKICSDYYASDFDLESIDNEDDNDNNIDIVDHSINVLIDDFNKIQDDLSVLSNERSKSASSSIHDDLDTQKTSNKDDKTESDEEDVEEEVSVIETSKKLISKNNNNNDDSSQCIEEIVVIPISNDQCTKIVVSDNEINTENVEADRNDENVESCKEFVTDIISVVEEEKDFSSEKIIEDCLDKTYIVDGDLVSSGSGIEAIKSAIEGDRSCSDSNSNKIIEDHVKDTSLAAIGSEQSVSIQTEAVIDTAEEEHHSDTNSGNKIVEDGSERVEAEVIPSDSVEKSLETIPSVEDQVKSSARSIVSDELRILDNLSEALLVTQEQHNDLVVLDLKEPVSLSSSGNIVTAADDEEKDSCISKNEIDADIPMSSKDLKSIDQNDVNMEESLLKEDELLCDGNNHDIYSENVLSDKKVETDTYSSIKSSSEPPESDIKSDGIVMSEMEIRSNEENNLEDNKNKSEMANQNSTFELIDGKQQGVLSDESEHQKTRSVRVYDEDASLQETDIDEVLSNEQNSPSSECERILNSSIHKEDGNNQPDDVKALEKNESHSTEVEEQLLLSPVVSSLSDKMPSTAGEAKIPSPQKCQTTTTTAATVDVKKRISEILADTQKNSPRGDKSPRLQDLYVTTYDLISPVDSPPASPTECCAVVVQQPVTTTTTAPPPVAVPAIIFNNEAEEILRKQLAIEQEIKQIITEQQQKEQQLPFMFVREIPNKPPPPYTPPSSCTSPSPSSSLSSSSSATLSSTSPAASAKTTIIPTAEEIDEITNYSSRILYKAYVSNNLANITISDSTLNLICKKISKSCFKFVFDLCKELCQELCQEHYQQFEHLNNNKNQPSSWLRVQKRPQLAITKPLDAMGLEKLLGKKLKEIFGYEKPNKRENAIIKWSRKRRDHVDEILVMESQAEEPQWTNYDRDELIVMDQVTNEIMDMLLKETGLVLKNLYGQ